MNILAIAHHLDRCEVHLLCSLKKLGFSITAITDAGQPYKEILAKSDIPVMHYTIKGRINLRAIFFLKRLLKANHFDLAHCFSSNALSNLILATIGSDIKRVAYRGTSGHLSRLDPTSWLTFLNPGVDKIICVSYAVSRYLRGQGVPESRLAPIYKGHDVAWYDGPAKGDFTEFGIPAGSFIVSCVANMRPVKGVSYLIEAMRSIPRDLPIHLLLVGDVRDEKVLALQNDPVFANRVHFTGYRTDAPSLVGGTHCFVMPSVSREGLAKALIEAMSKKVPPIITNVGGMPEVVRDGIEGLVVPPRDAVSLASSIITLYNDRTLCMRFSEASYRRICNDFNIQQTIDATAGVYKELLCS